MVSSTWWSANVNYANKCWFIPTTASVLIAPLPLWPSALHHLGDSWSEGMTWCWFCHKAKIKNSTFLFVAQKLKINRGTLLSLTKFSLLLNFSGYSRSQIHTRWPQAVCAHIFVQNVTGHDLKNGLVPATTSNFIYMCHIKLLNLLRTH